MKLLQMFGLNDDELEGVSGGAGSSVKYVKIVNCKNCVYVRYSPEGGNDENLIGYAYPGDKFVYQGSAGSWVRVKFGSMGGYIHKNYVEIIDA